MYYENPLTMLQQALVAMPGGRPAPAAPTYYGPMHQQLADYFNAGSTWRADFPRYVNQLMFDPEKRAMHGGFQIRDVIAPQPNNDWRIDWFKEDRAKAAADAAAAAAAAAAPPVNAGLLYQSWAQPYSYDGGNNGGTNGEGGTGGVGGAAGDGPGGGGGG